MPGRGWTAKLYSQLCTFLYCEEYLLKVSISIYLLWRIQFSNLDIRVFEKKLWWNSLKLNNSHWNYLTFLKYWNKVSLGALLCRSSWPPTHWDPPASASQMLGLRVCAPHSTPLSQLKHYLLSEHFYSVIFILLFFIFSPYLSNIFLLNFKKFILQKKP